MSFKNSLAMIAFVAMFSLTSCKSDTASTSTTTEVAPTTNTQPQNVQLPAENSANIVSDQNAQPVQLTAPAGNPQPVQITQPPTGSTPGTNPNSGKINPPHGQPGHTCSVAVGAVIP